MTPNHLAQCLGIPLTRATAWLPSVHTALDRCEASKTVARTAAFLSQIGHESAGLSMLEENLSYSAEALLRVFPKYFTKETAASYARNPERIANRVYANRNGNGNEASGDGWRFRARGPIGVTFFNNYKALSAWLGVDCVSIPGKLTQPDLGMGSAAWYWSVNNLNAIADTGDNIKVSKAVNLGNANSSATPNGLEDRMRRYKVCLEVLNGIR